MISRPAPYLIEVVSSTVHSCIEAAQGGAGRIELCSALAADGITPSSGLLEEVKRHVNIPIYVMIRPREGDFTYDAYETDVMKREMDLLGASGADGFVFGCLQADGRIDQRRTSELVRHAGKTPVTFHRAIDCAPNLEQAVEDIAACGCERILTSGGKKTAAEGRDNVLAMHEAARGRILIMPGSGINAETFPFVYHPEILEYHLSGRIARKSPMVSGLFAMDWAETSHEVIERIAKRTA